METSAEFRGARMSDGRTRGWTAHALTGLAVVCLMLASCGTAPPSSVTRATSSINASAEECPESAAQSKDVSRIEIVEGIQFDDVGEMVATSDLVIAGTVESIEPGPVVGEDDPKDPAEDPDVNEGYVSKLVDIRVDEVFFNDRNEGLDAGDAVTLSTWGWWVDGMTPIVVEGYPELCEGDMTVLFLKEGKLSRGRFVYTNYQSVYKIDGSEVADRPQDDNLIEDVERLSALDLRERVRMASDEVRAGLIKPVTPAGSSEPESASTSPSE
jgi:hypothetical protein